MIRAGKGADIPAITEMAEEFWRHTIYEEPVDPESVGAMASLCIGEGMMSVLEVDGEVVGFACGVVGPLLANHKVLTGSEIAWWVNPEHRSGRNGIALLKYLEGQAKARGVKYWNMIFMDSSMPERVESMYQRLGYSRIETTYTRVL